MTIIPIFRREMMAAVRSRRLQSERAYFAGQLMLMVVGSFAAWYYWAGGILDSRTMTLVANECLRWGVAFHAAIAAAPMMRGALSIAKERDKRTLDFLLMTRMTSAEIVLGKFAACVLICLGMMASGLPIMMLLHVLCGVDLRVILLAYTGFTACLVFLSSLSIWVSAEVPDARVAAVLFLLCAMAWMIGPFSVAVFPPRFGIRLPGWLAAANWWLVTSSPVSVAFSIATGLNSWPQLVHQVSRMIGLQLVGTVLFAVAAIARLRPAFRAIASIDRQARRRERRRFVWRFRPRPPVGDDPIYWREKYTSRENGFLKAASLLIFVGLLVGLAAGIFYFAAPAFLELWRYGYGSAATAAPEHQMNILVRMFMPRASLGGPVNLARTEFNLFIRNATTAIIVIMAFLVGGFASEVVGFERMKGTWSSLLATPLGARDILRSALKAAAWRSRGAFGAVIVLWTLGLAAGAIHPLGFVVSLLQLAASVWLMSTVGVLGSMQAKNSEAAIGQGLGLTLILTGSGVLPLLLPAGLNPVLVGAGSLPLMLWTSLVSYRELPAALASLLDPHFRWAGQLDGQMPLMVFASWLVAIVVPAFGGLWAWRYTLAHFDRVVGRPVRPADSTSADPEMRRPAAAIPRRGCPLAEADGAV